MEQLRATLGSLEEELRRAQTRLHQAHEEIEDLDRRKAAAAGTVSLAERAISDLETRLVEQREVFAKLQRLEEMRNELAARTAERDAAATEVATATEALLMRLDELAEKRKTLAAARKALRSAGSPVAAQDVGPEPPALRDQWERLLERIRADLDHELENDLVEAAARSPLGHAIQDLPAHLRILATERRRTLIEESSQRRNRS